MKLRDVERTYPGHRIALRHNPNEFYSNSFQVEIIGQRKLIVAKVKRHTRKGYRVVGFLKVRK